MKECFKCGDTKPLDTFYAHPMMGDGHLNKCKECTKADVHANYQRRIHDPAYIEAERARGREKYARLYRQGPNWTSPEAPADVKDFARQTLGNAVRDGRIDKPSVCGECGISGRIHGHHTDYFKPLDVAWLCSTCHRRAHATYPNRVKRSMQRAA